MFSRVLTIGYYSVLLLMILEAVTYSGAVFSRSVIDVSLLATLYLVVSIWLRTKRGYLLTRVAYSFNTFIVLPIALIASFSLALLESTQHANYVFSYYSVHFDQLGFIALFAMLIAYLHLPNRIWRGYYPYLLFSIPFVSIMTLLLLQLFPMDYLIQISKEDHLIEWTQFFVLVVIFVLSVWLSVKCIRSKQVILAVFFAGWAIVSLFLAGEEIAWGQRLFAVETPQILVERNVQKEITLHNLEGVADFVGQTYILVGLLLGLAWLPAQSIRDSSKLKLLKDVAPPWYLSSYFLLISMYNLFAMTINHSLHAWSEPIELLFYIGILLYIFRFVFLQKYSEKKLVGRLD